MKKITILLAVIFLMNMTLVWADEFDGLNEITPEQKEKLSQIHLKYKTENNALEQKIIEYNTQIFKLKHSAGKTPQEISLLTTAYERNISAIKEEQKQLEDNVNSLYKSILTEEQFKQYEEQQKKTEEAFNKFLQK